MDTFSSYGVGYIKIANANVLFLSQIVPSRVTRAHKQPK